MPSEITVDWIGDDNINIYVMINCYQSTPLIARNQSRDVLSKNDDIVSLIIDTFNDNRSG